MSPYNDSFSGLTQFRSSFRNYLPSSILNMCPREFHWRSLIFIRILADDVRASTATLRPVILGSILETVVLSFRCTRVVRFQDSHPCSISTLRTPFTIEFGGLYAVFEFQVLTQLHVTLYSPPQFHVPIWRSVEDTPGLVDAFSSF